MKRTPYPILREAELQLHLQVAAAKFDGWPELERAARRAIQAVRKGAEAVDALDKFAAEVLDRAERNTIIVKNEPADPSLELPTLGAVS